MDKRKYNGGRRQGAGRPKAKSKMVSYGFTLPEKTKTAIFKRYSKEERSKRFKEFAEGLAADKRLTRFGRPEPVKLSEFDKKPTEQPDGYYVVWHSGFFDYGGSHLWGFGGALVSFSNDRGFEAADEDQPIPDWMDETSEKYNECRIMFICESPLPEEFF